VRAAVTHAAASAAATAAAAAVPATVTRMSMCLSRPSWRTARRREWCCHLLRRECTADVAAGCVVVRCDVV
jgi:hypothetical protein